jgi:vesicle coat complex subunit
MGCIRVDKITEYLCDPLLKTLRDDDPYVRKTAAICVTKLYDINPELVEERGFLDLLREMVGDANPMVVANAVAALCEVADASGRRDVFPITSAVLFKLLAALNECTEWGQVFILDALAGYTATSGADAEAIVERVTPRLQHANCAVVLSAVKVALRQLPLLQGNAELLAALRKKLAPPLVTLLSAEPEIQYVALRNINLIIQKRPDILKHEMKVFFVKYNDPIYIKLEKLDIMIRLTSQANIAQVLSELKVMSQDCSVFFFSLRTLGLKPSLSRH